MNEKLGRLAKAKGVKVTKIRKRERVNDNKSTDLIGLFQM